MLPGMVGLSVTYALGVSWQLYTRSSLKALSLPNALDNGPPELGYPRTQSA